MKGGRLLIFSDIQGRRKANPAWRRIGVCPFRGFCFARAMTFASKITIARILMVPVFAMLALAYGRTVAAGTPDELLRWCALGVFLTAAGSDGLDGWIARRFNQVSKFGAFIDPIADKALLLTGVIVLALIDWGSPGWRLPPWFAATVVLRDCLILGGIGVLWKNGCKVGISPHWSGKLATVAQMGALGWVMLRVPWLQPVWPCAAATAVTLWSGAAYVRRGVSILQGKPQAV